MNVQRTPKPRNLRAYVRYIAAILLLVLSGCRVDATSPSSDACSQGWLAAKAWECLSGDRAALEPERGDR